MGKQRDVSPGLLITTCFSVTNKDPVRMAGFLSMGSDANDLREPSTRSDL